MEGKAKLEALTNAWYGYTLFAALVNIVSAFLGGGIFGFVAVPFVIFFSLFSLFVAWAIGKLLIKRSGLTRFIVLVFSGIGLLFGGLAMWKFVTGPWSFSGIVSAFVMGCGLWMQLRTLKTLTDRSVKNYFA
ncbi:MAG: hypothetical protein HOV80_34535 [Polyangiaceae bacterium]|nr:hypothetical protein [Polyangiaceae bacterium]